MAARLSPEQRKDRLMTEATLQSRVQYRARKYGWKVAHAGRGAVGAFGFVTPMSPGWPDLTLAKAHRPLLFIELKRELGRVEPEQVEWLQLLNQCGARAIIIRPSHLRDGTVDTILQLEEGFAADGC